MHTNVHCSTVYNSKDLEPTQIPIDDRMDWENVAHTHHGILCSHQKQWVCVLCRDKDEPEEHHSQQTDTRTKNQTPHVLTHRQVLNNEHLDTKKGASHTGVHWEGYGRDSGRDGRGGIMWGEMSGIGDGGMVATNHLVMNIPMQQSCMICTCTLESKVQFKKRFTRKKQNHSKVGEGYEQKLLKRRHLYEQTDDKKLIITGH